MERFLLQPLFVLSLTQVLLLFTLTVYLLSRKQKTKGTWLLALAMGLLSIIWMQQMVDRSIYGQMSININAIDELVIPFVVYLLLHFSYWYLSNPFKRESRAILIGIGFLLGLNVIYQLYVIGSFVSMPLLGRFLIELGNLVMIVVTLSVYIRKWSRKKNEKNNSDTLTATQTRSQLFRNKEEKALLAFVLLTAGMLLLSLRGVWFVASVLWPSLGTLSPFLVELNVPFFVILLVGFVVVYINYMPEPTTIQVKIIGLSLTTLLAVLGLTDMILFSDAKMEKEGLALLPTQQTIRFEPLNQGYRIAQVPYSFDPNLGENLGLGPETETRVILDFDFPFAGTTWDELFVDSNGLVSFGGPYLSTRFDDFYEDELPKIAPFYRSLVPLMAEESGVYSKKESDKLTVTWFLVWESLSGVATNRNTVQLVLYKDGVIEFVYNRIEAPFNGYADGLRGIRPVGERPPRETVDFTHLPPEVITAASLSNQDAVTFKREEGGGYSMVENPGTLDPVLGEKMHLEDDTNQRIGFDLTFPFYDKTWNEAYVSANGAISFGEPINPADSIFFRPFQDFFNETPKIAPFFVDLNPAQGRGVFHKNTSEKTTITWDQVPLLNTPFLNTVQLVLHKNGDIDFFYDRVGVALFGTDYWGIYAGDNRPRSDASDFLFNISAEHVSGDVALEEDFNLVYRKFVHAKIVPLAYIVLFSTLFILGVFPLFFRTSLIKPLESLIEGIKHIDSGKLDVRVPVRANDEIGLLAKNFNRMTQSLKDAEAQLRSYAIGLEEKVAERTFDLEIALQHLTETQDQLIHAEKMASLGSLTAGIAHEIKNPLNFINNFSEISVELMDEMLQELGKDSMRSHEEILRAIESYLPDLSHNARKIYEHGQRADGIVKSMLEHSQSGAGQRQQVDINALLNQYVELSLHGMKTSDQGNIQIDKDFEEGIDEIEMSPQEMGRVIINLLKNAIYSVNKRASVGDEEYHPVIEVSTRKAVGNLEIRISDNGIGIKPDNLGRIFEPFFTTKPTGTGTGLGLSLSHDIVTRGHNGTLEVESTEGNGATFTVTIPTRRSLT